MKQIKQLFVIMIAFVVVVSYPAGAFAAGANPILISNQSVAGSVGETTGVYERIRSKQVLNHAAPAEPVDVVKPLNVAENQSRLLRSGSSQSQQIRAEVKAGTSKTFNTWNPVNGNYGSVDAELAYSGRANVWVAGHQITTAQAEKLGKEFDQHIYPSDVTYFGPPAGKIGNGKVNIVCYNIASGDSGDSAYVAGFFNPMDLTSEKGSNRSEIIYIDVHPLMDTKNGSLDVTRAYSTLAHELQHLISFSRRVIVNQGYPLDPWIDEGLSMAAEQLYLRQPLNDRLDYYNVDPFNSIRNGLSPFNWHYDGDSLSNYSLSYLFFQYLRAQVNSAKQKEVYDQLIQDPNSGYRAVQDVIHQDISSHLSFGQFMTDFRLALYYNNVSGRYGFGDLLGHSLIARNFARGQSSQLTGGGAVLVPGNTKIHQSSSRDFQYLNLTPDGPRSLFSGPLSPHQVSVINHTGHYDRIYVKGIHSGDIVRVYSSSHHGLKKQTSRGSSTTLYLRQLGRRSGFVYVSVEHANTRESRWTRGYFSGERSATLSRSRIRIYNYRHHYDRVKVYGLIKGDCIRIYNSRKQLIARKYAHGRSLTVYIRQLGRRSGHIYVTVAHFHMNQSYKRYAGFRGE
ncbi:hypothetical protein [Sporolactobacillus vineae]|uniref:hypothetical protein n=1 Tax=Sporolactobacillus vineae TaxID=444463 RepID=UPI0002882CBA|nr:hypothetical protein [Sporolactobacillus vineae]